MKCRMEMRKMKTSHEAAETRSEQFRKELQELGARSEEQAARMANADHHMRDGLAMEEASAASLAEARMECTEAQARADNLEGCVHALRSAAEARAEAMDRLRNEQVAKGEERARLLQEEVQANKD